LVFDASLKTKDLSFNLEIALGRAKSKGRGLADYAGHQPPFFGSRMHPRINRALKPV
jgi:hypothetical protein